MTAGNLSGPGTIIEPPSSPVSVIQGLPLQTPKSPDFPPLGPAANIQSQHTRFDFSQMSQNFNENEEPHGLQIVWSNGLFGQN